MKNLALQRHINSLASMRPTPEGVGNYAYDAPRCTKDPCFNEAHARRRGKSLRQQTL